MKGDYSRWNPPKRRTLTLRKPNQDSLAAMQERIDRQHRFRMMRMRNGPGAGGGGLSQHPGSPIEPEPPPPVVPTSLPPTDITITPTIIPEQRAGAVIGVVTVTDPDLPNDYFFYTISDGRFEIVDGVFKLKSGSAMVFADEQSVTLAITVTDSGDNSLSKIMSFTVTEQIVPTPPNHAPTDILLDNRTVSDTELGAIVGNVTAIDPDLPDDTVVITVVGDPRFVVIPTGPTTGQLRLTPDTFVSHLLEPIINVTLRATDAGGLTADHMYPITVIDIAAPDLTNAIFVAPTTQGAGNGTSFANAFAFVSLASIIAAAAAAVPQKQVLLASHLGNYTGTLISITSGGTNGVPVIVRGCDAAGNEAPIHIEGGRQNPYTSPTGAAGSEILRLLAGANYLVFKNIDFFNCGNGPFRIGANITGLFIDTCNATNVRRFIENTVSGTNTTARLTNSRVRNCLVRGYSKDGIRFQYAGDNISLENVVCDSLQQDGDAFAVGFNLGSCTNVVLTDCLGRNNIDVSRNAGPPVKFYNGDGFSSERGSTVTFRRCEASGNTDGGFDTKATLAIFEDCKSSGSRTSYKIWGTATMLRCHGYDPLIRFPALEAPGDEPCQIEVNTSGTIIANVTCTDCTFVSVNDDPEGSVYRVTSGGASVLTTINTSVQKHASTPLVSDTSGVATITLDTKAGPPFTVDPVISAIVTAGETCTVTPGTVTGGVENAFQWMRRLPPATFPVYIDDAVSAGYTATVEDIGCVISCRQFTTDANGYMTESTSAESAVLVASTLTMLTPPVVGGPLGVNGILTVIPGTYDGIPQPTFTYQWKVNGVNANTGLTHTNVAGDVGKTVTVVETANNGTGAISTESAAVGPIVTSLAVAYVRPVGHGFLSGADWANAIGWASINSALAGMAPNGIIYIAAWDGDYAQIGAPTLSHGGTAVDALVVLDDDVDGNHMDGRKVPVFNSGGTRSPVTIQGVLADLTPSHATIKRGRTQWTLPYEGNVTDPFTTVAGSAIVNCHVPNHHMGSNTGVQQVLFRDQTAVGGITISGTGYYVVTLIPGDADNFTITHTAPAVSSAGPGGGVCRFEAVISISTWNISFGALTLANGANNLKLSYLNFEDCGEPGAIYISSNTSITNLEIDHCNFHNCRRFLEAATSATITNYYIHDCVGVGHSKAGIRLRNGTSMVVIEDCDINSGRQDRDSFSNCVTLDTGAHDVAIRSCTFKNCHDTVNSFWNGDTVSAELTNSYFYMADCTVSGCTDGGVDSKASYTLFRRIHSYDNKYACKIWSNAGGQSMIDDCVLEDSYRRGGTGAPINIEATGRPLPLSDPGMDLTIRNTIIRENGTGPGNGLATDDSSSNHNVICRQLENTYTNVVGTVLAGVDNLNISTTIADVTGPTITSTNTYSVYNFATTNIPLTADEGCSWQVVGGADAAIFSIGNSSGTTCHVGQYLRMQRQAYTGVDDVRVVTIQATDAANNHSAIQTITVTILAASPPYTFRCRFEGANGATAATDEAGGKPLGFSGNAQLTTTNPLEGTSSLLLDGNGDFVSCADSDDWFFDSEFSIIAKFNIAVMQDGYIVNQFSSTGGSNYSWALYMLATGELVFSYAPTGASPINQSTTGLGLTTGVNYEAAVDRDDHGVMRMYLSTAGGHANMVKTFTNGSAFRNCTAALRIGSQTAVTQTYFNGKIDDVRIWKGYSFCASDAGYTP